ncbi:MAG: CarD family transcriptional regulator, partial [Myxococcota bacterium]
MTDTAVEASLRRATIARTELLSKLSQERRVDVHGLPRGALASLLATAADGPRIVLVGDAAEAATMASNLAFFVGRAAVLEFPALDVSPYLAVAPDRRAAMDRLAALFHLQSGLPWSFLVAPMAAVLRRVMPRAAVARTSRLVEFGGELDRDELIEMLAAGGYLRTPVAEDPGTFAVRGGIVDVYAPSERYPARIELDFDAVESIKLFDPDDQRTIEEVERIFLHPARDTLLGPDRAAALQRVRDLCDEANYPSSKTRALIDDLDAGRAFYGIDGFLPAFHGPLETVFDYAGDSAVVLVDPPSLTKGADLELTRAADDLSARRDDGGPAYDLHALYLDEDGVKARIDARNHLVVHRLASVGAEDTLGLAAYEVSDEARLDDLGAEDQAPLQVELKARRAVGTEDALQPVAERVTRWLEGGLRVLLTARTHTQAERLVALLRGYGAAVETKVQTDPGAALAGAPHDAARVCVGELVDGFVWANEALALLTESEVFGTRARRTRARKRRKRKAQKAFLEDLKQLQPGDYVVHTDHGVGKYLGIERKRLGQSALERMRGEEAAALEVLVVEYAGGDRLFVPVTRLGQVQKFAGGDAKPKLDRLGGNSFAKKKAKAKKAVRKLADDLLVLYAERAAAQRPPLPPAGRLFSEFEATFPFEETPDQARAIDDVLGDLENPRPMDRLV